MAKPRKKALSQFLNRELSWLEFNQRVLDEACNRHVPLLERVKFFCITHSNLDEFFEVRVAGLKQQIESDVVGQGMDGFTATETFRAVTRRVRRMVEDASSCWQDVLVPELARNGIRFLSPSKLTGSDRDWLEGYYRRQVHPVLTPLAVDPSHPFPQVLNKSLNLITRVSIVSEGQEQRRLGIVQVPRVLPRLIRLPREQGEQDYVFLGDLIGAHLKDLYPGTMLGDWGTFRVTRNGELYIDEEEVSNLLMAVENELHNRRKGAAVRLEVSRECPADIREELLGTLGLTEEDLYVIDGPVNPTRLMAIYEGDHSPELREPPFIAPVSSSLRGVQDLFEAIRQRDHLLHHPYETYDTVVQFLRDSAADPQVLAIKQTLYRTGGDERIVGALMKAVKNGKQVTAVVELKARFDEANNIRWARALEEAGVHVVYGLVGYKIHCKACLVVRRDEDGIRRYVHLATGNYNPSTARFYTDVSYFTCRQDIAEDVTNLFNLLTGLCQFQGTCQLVVAPFELHTRVMDWIDRETRHAHEGLSARIVAKMNSLVDPEVIEALYRASRAGVQIDLIVRGICCLRPGVPGLSENIRVRSIVDRFLEHSRIWCFENASQPEVYVSSADWMPRNFFRRIELAFPILDGIARERILGEILARSLADNVKAKELQSDGTYLPVSTRKADIPHRSQEEFMHEANGIGPAGDHRSARRKGWARMELAPKPKQMAT